MKPLIITLGFLAGTGLASAALAQGAGDLSATVKICESCHGAGGNGTVATTPRLNGQQHDYIAKRLRDFLDVTRETPHATYNMWQVVANLSDAARSGLADYFSRQAPTQPKPGAQAALGARIYQNGVPAKNIPACQSCHGPAGEGRGAIPRLAGQHAEYLKTQMWVFSFQLRENDIMHPNTQNMDGAQIDAVADYLAGD